MSGRSPIESLRRLSPVSDTEAATVFGADGREELLSALTALPSGRGVPSPPLTRGRRRLVLALAALVVVATATAATWAVLRHAPARETTSVECVIKGVDTIIPSTSGDPAADCAAEWKRELGTAPRLVAYDNALGGVTVLPRSQKPPHGFKPLRSQDVALIELQDSLDDYIAGLNSSCLDGTAATSLADQKLARFGLMGWSVTLRSGSGACFAIDVVDPSTRTVTLIPTSAPTGAEEALFQKLATKLRPINENCDFLPTAVAAARAAANGLGLSESARTYELNAVTDNSLRCASIYETVGGTIFLTVRGPGR
jgi:hypothetical protein